MKIEEVEKWLETDEGKQWLEEKKRPLLKKNSDLLEEIALNKKRLTDETTKGNALEGKLNSYLAKLKKEMCLNCFDDYDRFKNRLISDKELREFVLSKIEKIADADGGLVADIDDNGEFHYQTADGKSFQDYYSEWLTTESAKSYIQNLSCGGGARGSGGSFDNFTKASIKKMTPEEVAKNLDNPTFRSNFENT